MNKLVVVIVSAMASCACGSMGSTSPTSLLSLPTSSKTKTTETSTSCWIAARRILNGNAVEARGGWQGPESAAVVSVRGGISAANVTSTAKASLPPSFIVVLPDPFPFDGNPDVSLAIFHNGHLVCSAFTVAN